MKKIFSLICILFIVGCAASKEKDTVLKVNLSPYNSKLNSKRVGVLPFIGENKVISIEVSDAIMDNLVTSGLYIIEQKHLLTEFKNFLKKKDKSSADNLNEWEKFKILIRIRDDSAIGNLVKLKELDLVDYLIRGKVHVNDKFIFFAGEEIMEAELDIINVHNGAIVYSMNYTREEKSKKITPRQLGKKFVDALMVAMK